MAVTLKTPGSWKTPGVFFTVGLSGLIISGIALNSLLSVPVSETVEQKHQRESVTKRCMGFSIAINIIIMLVIGWYLVWRLKFSHETTPHSGCILIPKMGGAPKYTLIIILVS